MNIFDVITRLKAHISRKTGANVTDKELAEALGINHVYISQLKKRESIPFEKIIAYCKEEDLSLDYVFLGKEPTDSDNDDGDYICRFFEDVHGSCGAGSDNESNIIRHIKLDRAIIETVRPSGVNFNIEAIRAIGDSMEPRIKDGAIVLVDRNDTNVQKMGIFALKTEDGLHIKRLCKNGANKVDIISENTIYAAKSVDVGYIDVIGRVVGMVERV